MILLFSTQAMLNYSLDDDTVNVRYSTKSKGAIAMFLRTRALEGVNVEN